MDEFIRGLELLLNAPAGQLIVVAGIVFIVGGGILSFFLMRVVLAFIDQRREEEAREDTRQNAQNDMISQLVGSILGFTDTIKDATRETQQAVRDLLPLVTTVQEMVVAFQRAQEQRSLEHERQDLVQADVARQLALMLEEVRKLPAQFATVINGSNTDCKAELLTRIEAMENKLVSSVTRAVERVMKEHPTSTEKGRQDGNL